VEAAKDGYDYLGVGNENIVRRLALKAMSARYINI